MSTNEQNIEVEIRGPLTTDEYNTLDTFLSHNAEFIEKRERVLIDYSTDGENRTKDIRIRETNGEPEIVLKLGSWGGSEGREEISIRTEHNKFDSLVRIFGELGFTKGVLCVRNSIVYKYKDVEFALIEVPNHSYFFEAEILTTKDKSEEAENLIGTICKELNLKSFSREEFLKYVQTLNAEANKNFEYKDYKDGYFRDKKYLR